MQQSINLLDHLDKREALAVSATHIAQACGLTFVLLVLLSALLAYTSGQKAALVDEASRKQDQLQAQLEEMRSASTTDTKEIDRLRRLIDERRQVLATISAQSDAPTSGFSEHLSGLGRAQITGLWLTSISLNASGDQISLQGEMREAALLPRYLQDLGKESVFSGLRFQLMRIEDIEDKEDQMAFEVTVIPEVVAADQDGGEA